jgi:hypothetical protein
MIRLQALAYCRCVCSNNILSSVLISDDHTLRRRSALDLRRNCNESDDFLHQLHQLHQPYLALAKRNLDLNVVDFDETESLRTSCDIKEIFNLG